MTPDIILQRTGIDVRAVEQGDDAWHKLRLGVNRPGNPGD